MITYETARRTVMVTAGFLILATGIVMIVLPGPAILVIPLGLSLLSGEFLWARNLLKKIQALKERFSSMSPGLQMKSLFGIHVDRQAAQMGRFRVGFSLKEMCRLWCQVWSKSPQPLTTNDNSG